MKIEDYLIEDKKKPSFLEMVGNIIIFLLCVAGWGLWFWAIYVIYNFAKP